MSPRSNLGRWTDASLLFSRDVCADVFGNTAITSTCTPSNTLCCVRRGQVFPSCQQYLGKGWCCTGPNPTDNCYVDQESVCNEPNPVPCTQLAAGTTEACCPRLTSCAANFNASRSQVRCNIQYADLKRAAVSSASPSASSASTTSTFSTSTSQTLLASSSTSSVVTPAANPSGLPTPLPIPGAAAADTIALPSPGLVAGAAIGGTLAFVAIGLLAFIILRRQRKKKEFPKALPVYGESLGGYQAYGDQTSTSNDAKPVEAGGVVYLPHGQGQGYPPAEIMTRNLDFVAELDGRDGR